MKTTLVGWAAMAAVTFLAVPLLHGQDMRAINQEQAKIRAALEEKIRAGKARAEQEAEARRLRIVNDRGALKTTVADLERKNAQIAEAVDRAARKLAALADREKTLSAELSEMDSVVRELAGFVRTAARDVDALISQSPQSAMDPHRGIELRGVFAQNRFPGMDDIRKMVGLMESEIRDSGQVRRVRAPFVDRSGLETEGEVLLIGNFTAAYRLGDETGFLNYSAGSRRFFALSRLPPAAMQRQLNRYMDGLAEDVPMDISRGAALRQLTHRLSLVDQIPGGGPIVWPILGILALALLIVIERILYLTRKGSDADRLMNEIRGFAVKMAWDRCCSACLRQPKKPVSKVLLAGLNARDMSREEMENALQEAILREIPGLERFLSTLGMLAAIAPLLGLLGTVTGMINTFHAITAFGTGDPRMMSGGISEALVTTMLGLSVAIPIIFGHTLISRVVENRIGQMEEKAVALVNLVDRSRTGKCSD